MEESTAHGVIKEMDELGKAYFMLGLVSGIAQHYLGEYTKLAKLDNKPTSKWPPADEARAHILSTTIAEIYAYEGKVKNGKEEEK